MSTDNLQAEALRAAPAVGVGGLSLWGVPINEWLILLTVVYTIFLIVDKFPTVVKRFRALWQMVKEKYGKGN